MHATEWIIGGAVLASVAGWVAPQRATARDAARCAPAELSERIASTGLDADGGARARWRQDDRCRQSFSVEVEDLPAGDYALLVGDVERGTLTVRPTATGSAAEIEFESPDDTPHPLTLTFDPIGAIVVVRGAAGIYFADVFDGVGAPPAGTPVPTRTAVPTNAAATPTAASTRAATGTPAVTRTADDSGGARTRTAAATGTAAATRTADDRGGLRTRTASPTRTPTALRATRTSTPTRIARTTTPMRPSRTATAVGSRRSSNSGSGGWLFR